jgi:hypothetical protein
MNPNAGGIAKTATLIKQICSKQRPADSQVLQHIMHFPRRENTSMPAGS